MYESLARYYDQLHLSLTEDVGLILRLAKDHRGKVLELGCGTGRLLRPLARAGFAVVGVDNSAAMLALARQQLGHLSASEAARVTLIEGDMLHLPISVTAERYSLAIVPFNTLLHFRSHEVAMIFRQVAGLLGQDGMLLVDVAAPLVLEEQVDTAIPVLEARIEDEVTGAQIEQWSQSRLDSEAQTYTVYWQFKNLAEPGATQIVKMDYHYYYPHQLEILLRESGLRMVGLMGDYDSRPFTEESERLLLTAVGGRSAAV